MKCVYLLVLTLMIQCGFVAPLNAQEAEPQADPPAAIISGFWQSNAVGAWNRRTPPLAVWYLNQSHLASEDGNYLAQNEAELQTYVDLGLDYRFIEEEFLREQLGLPDEQGIIIEGVDEAGEGFRNGFREGDIVLTINEIPVDTQYDLVIALTEGRGEQQSAKVRRSGNEQDLVIVLSEPAVESPKRWIIGVFVDEITDVTRAQLGIESGVAITQLTEDGPAQQNGMVVHDIITHINGTRINSMEELREVVGGSNGAALKLEVVRMGKQVHLEFEPQQVVDASANVNIQGAYVDLSSNLIYDAAVGQWQGINTPQGAYQWGNVLVDGTETQARSRLDALEKTVERLEEKLNQLLENK